MYKEKPILFSTPMVKAILDGRKSQTRRIVKPQPVIESFHDGAIILKWDNKKFKAQSELRDSVITYYKNITAELIPFAGWKVNDRLWVRETIFESLHLSQDPSGEYSHFYGNTFEYYADGKHTESHYKTESQYSAWMAKRPSIHMPKKAARIWLEVTNVRVERLNDISEVDAIAEGSPYQNGTCTFDGEIYEGCYKNGYKTIWESLNGKGSWELNPWVWVIEFKKINN